MAAKKFLSGIDMASQRLVNLADGSSPADAVTLQQVQAYVRGLSWKAAVAAASTANVTLTGPGASIDGVSLTTGDRVLLKNQTTASENGVYSFDGASSALTRTADAAAAGAEAQTLTSGMAVYVTGGTVNADTAWVLTTPGPIVVDTTSLVFTQFGGAAAPYLAGNGIAISSQVVSAVVKAASGLSVGSGGLGITLATNPGLTLASGLGIELDAAPGLAIGSSGLAVEVAADGGLDRGSGGLSVLPGAGVLVDSGGVHVDTSKVVRKYAADVGDGSSTSITVTHSLGTLDVTVALYTVSDGTEVDTDVVHTSTNTITLNFAAAPSSGQYRVVVHG